VLRVAAAVVALVVVQHAGDDLLQIGDVAEDVAAFFRMLPDFLVLPLSRGPGFLRIASVTPILPTSCRRAPISMMNWSSSDRPMREAMALAIVVTRPV